ncbi:MAG: hypothetical protein IJL91_06870 [Bacteroidales bacterium]|nr:hypothetical protein [Bacteroidales bacterium]
MKIAPMSGMAWSLDILTGQQPFPTFQKERKGEGFKEVLDKEMERWRSRLASSTMPPIRTNTRGLPAQNASVTRAPIDKGTGAITDIATTISERRKSHTWSITTSR